MEGALLRRAVPVAPSSIRRWLAIAPVRRMGRAGAGKTALLEYVAGRTADCHAARTAGVQSEMELAFAGLHQ
jgi:hypothetical protein